MSSKVCYVIGVGPGNGAAFARAFHAQGYAVGMLARSRDTADALVGELSGSCAVRCDVREPRELAHALDELVRTLGAPDVVIYNAGAGAFEDVHAASVESLESAWRTNTLGLFATVKHLLPSFIAKGAGSIVVIGATAALRGGARFLPFASAKAAQRSLAQSLAKSLGPNGIHVSYVILDGVVDLPRTRAAMPDRPDAFFLAPDAIAQAVLDLTRQSPQAWTFELDLRPFGETW